MTEKKKGKPRELNYFPADSKPEGGAGFDIGRMQNMAKMLQMFQGLMGAKAGKLGGEGISTALEFMANMDADLIADFMGMGKEETEEEKKSPEDEKAEKERIEQQKKKEAEDKARQAQESIRREQQEKAQQQIWLELNSNLKNLFTHFQEKTSTPDSETIEESSLAPVVENFSRNQEQFLQEVKASYALLNENLERREALVNTQLETLISKHLEEDSSRAPDEDFQEKQFSSLKEMQEKYLKFIKDSQMSYSLSIRKLGEENQALKTQNQKFNEDVLSMLSVVSEDQTSILKELFNQNKGLTHELKLVHTKLDTIEKDLFEAEEEEDKNKSEKEISFDHQTDFEDDLEESEDENLEVEEKQEENEGEEVEHEETGQGEEENNSPYEEKAASSLNIPEQLLSR